MSWDAMLSELARARAQGKSLVLVSGNFNIVHPGHLRLLQFAAEQGDVLIVGVNPDTVDGVTLPAAMRQDSLRHISIVDHVFLIDRPIEEVVRTLRPDVVVKGKEYENRPNAEAAVLKELGGRLVFGSGEVVFSSIELLRREYRGLTLSTIDKPQDFPRRHGFDVAGLNDVLERLSAVRVLVVGDLIVDTYVNCEPLGMSQEDPTVVVTPLEEMTFIGGAAIVAAHASGMGAKVSFVSVCGDDEAADFARARLGEYGVDAELFADPTRPTTNKQRFRARGKTLLRVNHLRQRSIDAVLADRLLAAVEARLPQTDLILFSDFNYGCLPQTVVDAISAKARARGIMLAADSQASSQLSDISRFKGMTLMTPTEREARLALKDSESGLIVVAERLQQAAQARHVVVTLGAEGLLIYARENGRPVADRLPAFNTAPKDVAGAGDSFFTSASLALCAGVDIWRSVYLGSLAAACQVSRVGNTPLTVADIAAEINYQ